MFNYGGSKYWLARRYPAPTHDTIVEPFAGSAQYSMHHWHRKVILIEKNERTYAIWKYLQRATPEEIRSLPTFEQGEPVLHPVPEARDLIALGVNRGTSRPQRVAGKFGREWVGKRLKIADSLHKIQHWDIRLGDYSEAPDVQATWFIDPPYANIKTDYLHQITDYNSLGCWCRSRQGQVLVCESPGADWLPFEHFHLSKNTSGRGETMWVRP